MQQAALPLFHPEWCVGRCVCSLCGSAKRQATARATCASAAARSWLKSRGVKPACAQLGGAFIRLKIHRAGADANLAAGLVAAAAATTVAAAAPALRPPSGAGCRRAWRPLQQLLPLPPQLLPLPRPPCPHRRRLSAALIRSVATTAAAAAPNLLLLPRMPPQAPAAGGPRGPAGAGGASGAGRGGAGSVLRKRLRAAAWGGAQAGGEVRRQCSACDGARAS